MLFDPLPPRAEMLDAFHRRDPAYEGVFVTCVRTTGIFCRPTCPARKPRSENVEFFPAARDALAAGYRPCRRCRPLEPKGQPPDWLRPLIEAVEEEPARRWRDDDLRRRGLEPERVRRWFKAHHGMTFQAYQRTRRLGLAWRSIRDGAGVTDAAFDHGYESESAFREAFERLFGASPAGSRGTVMVTLARVGTPLGPMLAGATDEGLCLLEFADRRMLETQVRRLERRLGARFVPGSHPHLDTAAAELDAYFAGRLKRFSMPLVLDGTDFQRAVWEALLQVPYGTTSSYGDLAAAIGRPTAVRAVGRANGDNRLAIVVPCHRIVGSDGRLVGYGGGLRRKEALLRHELEHRSV